MGLGSPLANDYLEPQQKEHASMKFIYQSPVTKWRNCLEANQYIDGSRKNRKNRHPYHGLPQTGDEANMYARFVYVPLII